MILLGFRRKQTKQALGRHIGLARCGRKPLGIQATIFQALEPCPCVAEWLGKEKHPARFVRTVRILNPVRLADFSEGHVTLDQKFAKAGGTGGSDTSCR